MIDQELLSSIQHHAGCPCPPEAIEIVYKESEKVARDRCTSIEFILAEQVKALWSEANQRQFNAAGKPVDFTAFCKAKLAKSDGLFSKLLVRKSKAAKAVADAEQFEAEIDGARAGLKASEAQVSELTNAIARAEAELIANSHDAVEQSINRAAEIWHMRHRSPHHESIVSGAVSHAVEQEVVGRILNARLLILRDKLAAEQAKVEAFTKQLKALEKQG